MIRELTWRPEKRRTINFKDLFGVSHFFIRTEDLGRWLASEFLG